VIAKRRRKGRIAPGAFFGLHHSVIKSRQFQGLSGPAIRLLMLIATQHKADNNGLLVCTAESMAPFGWRSSGMRHRGLTELMAAGLLCCTRLGGLHRAALYALAWLDCDVPPEKHGQFAGRFVRCQLDQTGQTPPLETPTPPPKKPPHMANSRYVPHVRHNESTKTALIVPNGRVNSKVDCSQREGQIVPNVGNNESMGRHRKVTSPNGKTVDWRSIEIDFRAGRQSLRQIARAHGITHPAIIKRGKRDGWSRDMSARTRAGRMPATEGK